MRLRRREAGGGQEVDPPGPPLPPAPRSRGRVSQRHALPALVPRLWTTCRCPLFIDGLFFSFLNFEQVYLKRFDPCRDLHVGVIVLVLSLAFLGPSAWVTTLPWMVRVAVTFTATSVTGPFLFNFNRP